jgi:hypothetical protein
MHSPFALDGYEDLVLESDLSQSMDMCSTSSPAGSPVKSSPTVDAQAPEVRLFACSDLHVDALENRQWLENLSTTEYKRDALIVAGDLSEELDAV